MQYLGIPAAKAVEKAKHAAIAVILIGSSMKMNLLRGLKLTEGHEYRNLHLLPSKNLVLALAHRGRVNVSKSL
jgi:hypothetical protein